MVRGISVIYIHSVYSRAILFVSIPFDVASSRDYLKGEVMCLTSSVGGNSCFY